LSISWYRCRFFKPSFVWKQSWKSQDTQELIFWSSSILACSISLRSVGKLPRPKPYLLKRDLYSPFSISFHVF
jgi:hypothetical protein